MKVLEKLFCQEKDNMLYSDWRYQMQQSNEDYLTTPEAAEQSGLTSTYLTYLLRNGKLEGLRRGRDWFVSVTSLEAFLANPRKSGPKGPRNRSVSNRQPEIDEKKTISSSNKAQI